MSPYCRWEWKVAEDRIFGYSQVCCFWKDQTGCHQIFPSLQLENRVPIFFRTRIACDVRRWEEWIVVDMFLLCPWGWVETVLERETRLGWSYHEIRSLYHAIRREDRVVVLAVWYEEDKVGVLMRSNALQMGPCALVSSFISSSFEIMMQNSSLFALIMALATRQASSVSMKKHLLTIIVSWCFLSRHVTASDRHRHRHRLLVRCDPESGDRMLPMGSLLLSRALDRWECPLLRIANFIFVVVIVSNTVTVSTDRLWSKFGVTRRRDYGLERGFG